MTAVTQRPTSRTSSRAAALRRAVPRPGDRRRILVLELALVAALPLFAASALRPIFDGWAFLLRASIPCIAAAGAEIVGLRRRLASTVRATAALGAGLVTTVYATLGDTMPSGVPTGDTIRSLSDTVTSGWSITLDAPVPLPIRGVSMCLIALLSVAATVIGSELVIGTRSVLTPALPGLVLFALTLPLAAPTDESTLGQASLLSFGMLLFVLARSSPELAVATTTDTQARDQAAPSTVVSSRIRSGLPAALLSVLVGSAIVANIADADRFDPFDPRDLRTESVDLSSAVNPIFEVRANVLLDPPEVVAEIDLPDPADAGLLDRLGIITLETYDGATWSSLGNFTPASDGFSADDEVQVEASEVELAVSLVDLDPPWLPAGRNPISVTSSDVLVADSSGAVVRSVDFEGRDYEVVSLVPTLTDEELAAYDAPAEGALTDLTALPTGAASEFGPLAQELMGTGTLIEQLRRLEGALREIPYDPESDGGHSIGRVRDFLYEERFGLAEQHAAAFALLTRSRGIPTRLVVGLRTIEFDEDGVATPLSTLTTSQYHVWAEVRFEEVGWVPFDPTPTVATSLGGTGGSDAAAGESIGQQSTPQQSEPIEGVIPDDEGPSGNRRRTASLAVTTVLTIGVLYVVAVLLLKRRRRARRRFTGSPSDQIVGAWTEATDRMLEAGFRPAPAMTLAEISDTARARTPDPETSAIDELVPTVRRALYSLRDPSPETVDEAWDQSDRFGTEIMSTLSTARRLRASLDPRPLLPRR